MDVEVLSWSLSLQTVHERGVSLSAVSGDAGDAGRIRMFDGDVEVEALIIERSSVTRMVQKGPALVVEDQTSIVVPAEVSFFSDEHGDLFLTREASN